MFLRSGTILVDRFSTFLSIDKIGVSENMAENKQEIKCVSFDPTNEMLIENWLNYFNKFCEQNEVDETWKFQNVSKFLKGHALTTYINECLGCTTFKEVAEILKEKFLKVTLPNFSEFSNLHLDSMSQLEEYFHRKLNCGRKLGLTESLILQGLTDGLPPEFKNILVINPSVSATEWYQTVSKLVPPQNSSAVTTTSPVPQPNTGNFRPRNFNYNVPFPTRQFIPRNWVRPNNYNSQPQRFRNFIPQHNPHQNFNPRGNTFYSNTRMPSRPCRMCTNAGIFNAYHWEAECQLQDPSGTHAANVQIPK